MFIQNAKECNQELSDQQEKLGLNVTSVNDSVVAAQTSHGLSRISEKFTYDGNVTAFKALQSTVVQLASANPNASGEANQEHYFIFSFQERAVQRQQQVK
eukprot:s1366_g11.t1